MSTVKVVGAESALPSYMYLGGVNVYAASSLFINNFKGKGTENSEDDVDSDHDQHTLLSTFILKWYDPESDRILFSCIPPNDLYIGTKNDRRS